jgi:hypothetical protein
VHLADHTGIRRRIHAFIEAIDERANARFSADFFEGIHRFPLRVGPLASPSLALEFAITVPEQKS